MIIFSKIHKGSLLFALLYLIIIIYVPNSLKAQTGAQLYQQKIETCHTEDVADCITEYALNFVGTPYVAHTLEGNPTEQLVVNLTQLDCATFVETVVAMALSSKTEATRNFESFQEILQKLRYRKGKIKNYCSRIHYFSDWLFENEQNGWMQNITQMLGGKRYEKSIDFMSHHPNAYAQLKNNPNLVAEIAAVEQDMNTREMYYIPKENIEAIEPQLQNGDILAITTSVAGLDVAHEGLVYKKGSRVHLLHASSDFKKVMISEEPLVEYIAKHKGQTGIMVARAK